MPAIWSSRNILNSALKAGQQLSSVVITSSTAAVFDPKGIPAYVYTEADFTSTALDKVLANEQDGMKSPSGYLCRNSKLGVEHAVEMFRQEHKPHWSISSIIPTMVVGPPLLLPASGLDLNDTLKPIFNLISGTTKDIDAIFNSCSWVDVRDVATMHFWAYENAKKSSGKSYIACGGFGPMQAVADILHEKYRGTEIVEKIVVGKPGRCYDGFNKKTQSVEDVLYPAGKAQISGKKAEREMGIKWISFKQSIGDTADVLEALL